MGGIVAPGVRAPGDVAFRALRSISAPPRLQTRLQRPPLADVPRAHPRGSRRTFDVSEGRLTGARLAIAVEWSRTEPDVLSGLERQFLDASIKAQTQETRVSRRRTRQLRWLASGLAAYRRQAWADAEVEFSAALELVATDAPSRVFLERVAHLRAEPPAADWNGVWALTSK